MLKLLDVSFDYGAPRAGCAVGGALRNVSLHAAPGDRVGVMGASGSGKSTLLLVMAGLRRPRRGTVERGASALPSLVFQFPERHLFGETVHEDVAYGLRESGVARADVDRRVRAALEEVGLPPNEFAARAPFHLSGGEMRRAALAGALAQERSLLLLDEPTLGLDAEGCARLHAALQRVHARGVAIWVASHDADFIAATCDRIVVLDAGRIAFQGAARELWSDQARAAALGVHRPRAAAWAEALRVHGYAVPDETPDEAALLEALGRRPAAAPLQPARPPA
jgi:energy-coupling factor transport system ATP-binding protein